MKDVKEIEKTFLTNDQLSLVKILDNREPLVDIKDFDNSIVLKIHQVNIPFTGETIYFRREVAKKLADIQKELSKKGLGLKICDGYRSVEVQQQYWDEEMKINREKYPNLSETELEEKTSKFVAKPSLALHATGGAVDLTIIELKSGKELPMGTELDESDVKSYVEYPDFSDEIKNNRKLLLEVMTSRGFYSLPSEWWHFSYGTIDWAFYYKKESAIYGIVKK